MSSVQTAPCPVFTMRQPYKRPGQPHPSELTQHLRNNLIAIQERHRRRRTTNAQVEQNGSTNRNIKSDSPAVASHVTITDALASRGAQGVPKRFLKTAEWKTQGELGATLGTGYYVEEPDAIGDVFIPIDFIFSALQWGITELRSDGYYHVERPAPIKYGLRIYDKECVDRSRWGPTDLDSDEEDVVTPDSTSTKAQSPGPPDDINVASSA